MKKIKTIENDEINVYSFKLNLLKDDNLYKICRVLNLNTVYIDIFGIGKRSLELSKKLSLRNNGLMLYMIDNSGGLAIKSSISDLPIIVETLIDYEFDELNIWDVYTNWEKYLLDKKHNPIYFSKTPKLNNNNKIYLNYNIHAGKKVELFIDRSCNIERINEGLYNTIIDK